MATANISKEIFECWSLERAGKRRKDNKHLHANARLVHFLQTQRFLFLLLNNSISRCDVLTQGRPRHVCLPLRQSRMGQTENKRGIRPPTTTISHLFRTLMADERHTTIFLQQGRRNGHRDRFSFTFRAPRTTTQSML